jgi:hypothetical protein
MELLVERLHFQIQAQLLYAAQVVVVAGYIPHR